MCKHTSSGGKIFYGRYNAVALEDDERKEFYILVVKLLYLAKMAHPDLLSMVSFLSTRISRAAKEDANKLLSMLAYLKGTHEWTLKLTPLEVPTVESYVDTAFACHADSKSHIGVMVFIGSAMGFATSRNQNCETKLPTESELVALMDYVGLDLLTYLRFLV